jgi:hypothetical protein
MSRPMETGFDQSARVVASPLGFPDHVCGLDPCLPLPLPLAADGLGDVLVLGEQLGG